MTSETVFDPQRILAALVARGVDFVIIGGVAAVLHGAAYVTVDLDVCPSTDHQNLDRLSAALEDLDARIRVEGVPEGFAFSHDGAALGRATIWNLQTNAGDLDLAISPSAVGGFEALAGNASQQDLGGLHVLVASLDDIIRSKRAANRPKDHLALPQLERLRDELS